MARRKKDAADSKDYVPRPAETEAEVLSMGFPNTGDADRDTETFMNDRARDEAPPRDREDKDSEEDEEENEGDEEEELQVGGQRLKVRKDVAAVLRAQELQLSELRTLQNRNIQPLPAQQEEEPDPLADAEKTLFADPRGTLIKYGESLKKQIRQELTTQYQADRKTDQYFKEFYTEHKDLAPLDETVKGVLRANIQEVAALNPKASRDRLAQLVRMQIDTIVKTVVPDNDERREARRTTVEGATRGGTSRQGNKQQAPRQEVVKSLSSVIRDRKMLRANARTATR